MHATTNRPLWEREVAVPIVRSDERVSLLGCADENAVADPLGLHKLELPIQMRANEDERNATIGSVILEDTFWKQRTVTRAAANHAVEADVDVRLIPKSVAWMHPSRVRPGRAAEPPEIVVVIQKVIVAVGIGAERGIVSIWAQREWRAALPAAFHLRPQLRLLLGARCVRAKKLPECRDPGVELEKNNVGAIAAEYFRLRHRRQAAGFVWISEDEFAGLDRRLFTVRPHDATALHRGLTDPILEAERVSACWKLVTVLTPNELDPWQLGIGAARSKEDRFELFGTWRKGRQSHVDLWRSKWLFPTVGTVLADIAELLGT